MNWKYNNPKFEYEEKFQDLSWPWSGHKFFAYDLVSNIKPGVIVELGTHYGTSLWSFCQAVKDNKLQTKIFSVDTWKGEKHAGFYGEEVFETVNDIKDKYYNGVYIKLKRMTFDDALSDFEDNSIDILHIDGLHTYDAVTLDFENWIPKVKEGGIVLLHDIMVNRGNFGVYKLWEELKNNYKTIEFQFSYGLGILIKGDNSIYENKNELVNHYSYFLSDFEKEELNKKDFVIKQTAEVNNLKQKEIEEIKKIAEEKETIITEQEEEIKNLKDGMLLKENEINALKNSTSWKITKPVRAIVDLIKKIIELIKLSLFVLRNDGPIVLLKKINKFVFKKIFTFIKNKYLRVVELFYKSFLIIKKDGLRVFLKKTYLFLRGHKNKKNLQDQYEIWIKQNENFDIFVIKKEINDFKYKPKISIITPVYNVDSKWLDKCIQSVRSQFYENWELCLHDDASTKKETIECLKKWEKLDSRIKISYGKVNQHISGSSNEALKLATGGFIALLDNDDELAPHALFENVKVLNEHPDTDFIYSDEDKIEETGERVDPFFKPDWSPDLFLSMMYTCHLGVYRKRIIDKIGGFRKGYEGSQDYDMVLRFIENISSNNIYHIPKILYHWRKIPGSTASRAEDKSYTWDSSKKALKDYLERNNIKGDVEEGVSFGRLRVKRQIQDNPLVSIIIPFRDKSVVLEKCIGSILEKTNYKNYEVLLIDNKSSEKETFQYLDILKDNLRIKILKYADDFNFSAINNYAVKKALGEYILFLNNDTEVINQDWLSSMVEHIQRDEVGAVGAKLIYPNNTIQHAGVIMGLGIAGHAFKYFSADQEGPFSQLNVIKNYSAVTAACMMVKKKTFLELKGFNEKDLSVAYNDVDLCLRIREKGYLIVYTPYAKLYHYESLSRGNDEDFKFTNPEKYKRVILEREYMQNKWKDIIENDPYYNPNLTRKREDFGIRVD